jgi:hypothetical protein
MLGPAVVRTFAAIHRFPIDIVPLQWALDIKLSREPVEVGALVFDLGKESLRRGGVEAILLPCVLGIHTTKCTCKRSRKVASQDQTSLWSLQDVRRLDRIPLIIFTRSNLELFCDLREKFLDDLGIVGFVLARLNLDTFWLGRSLTLRLQSDRTRC